MLESCPLMEEKQLIRTMQLMDSARHYAEMECAKIISFTENYKERLLAERGKLPYHINVIDELHINENGHSRVLTQLLKFTNAQGKYELLELLVQYIRQKSRSAEFDRIVIKKPLVTQEEFRIDLWVRDKEGKYALIVENKAYNAVDQEAQLERYIDTTKELGWDENDIFVVYLSQSGKEPDVQSWGPYEEAFKPRYISLSFRHDILPWLKNDILPQIRQKDLYLQTAIHQYIDYLEGLFRMRTIEKQMNMNLDSIIKEQLNLQGKTVEEQILALQKEMGDFNEVLNQMSEMELGLRKQIFKGRTRERYPELHPNESEAFTDVTLSLNGKNLTVFIWQEPEKRGGEMKLYCQVNFDKNLPEEERLIADTPIDSLKDILPSSDSYSRWKWFPMNDFEGVFSLFCQVVDRLKEIASKG